MLSGLFLFERNKMFQNNFTKYSDFLDKIFWKISTKFQWKFQMIYNRGFLKHFKLRWFPLYANWRKHLFFTILLVSPCVWMINLTLTLWLVWISLGSLTVEHTSEGRTLAERPLRLQNYSIVASLQCSTNMTSVVAFHFRVHKIR